MATSGYLRRCVWLTKNEHGGARDHAYRWVPELQRAGINAVVFEFEFLFGDAVKEEFKSKEITYFSKHGSAPSLIGPYPIHDPQVLTRIKRSRVEDKLRLLAISEVKKSLQSALQEQDWKRARGNLQCVLREDPLEPSSINIRTLDDPDVTALMLATESNNLSAVQKFVQTFDVDARDQDGNTALLRARSASEQVISTLINAGADVNAQNKRGESALMQTAYMRNARAVQSLLVHRA